MESITITVHEIVIYEFVFNSNVAYFFVSGELNNIRILTHSFRE